MANYCNKCGTKLNSEANFCNKCGNPINNKNNEIIISSVANLPSFDNKQQNPFSSLSKNPSKTINYETKLEFEKRKQKELEEYNEALLLYDKVFDEINNNKWEPTPYDWSLMEPERKYGHTPIGNVLNSWSDSFLRDRSPHYSYDYTGEIKKLEKCIYAFKKFINSDDKIKKCEKTIIKIKDYNKANLHLFYKNENWFLFKELSLEQPLPIFKSLGKFKNSDKICEQIEKGDNLRILGFIYFFIGCPIFFFLCIYLLCNKLEVLLVILFISYILGVVYFLKNDGRVRNYSLER